MLNKKDPLIDAIQQVMQSNQADRDAVKAVNEKFGIQDRRVLPRERQGEWDAAYKTVLTEGVEALDEKSFAALAPPYDKATHKDKLVGAGVLKKHPTEPGKHVLAKEEKKMKGDDPCWDTHKMVGMKKGKGGKPVPKCVPVSEEGDPSKAIPGDTVTGGSSVTPVPKPKTQAPAEPRPVGQADQSRLKTMIQNIKEAKKAAMCEGSMKKTMGEFKRGKLHSGSKTGPIVKSRDQAIAIGMNNEETVNRTGKGDLPAGASASPKPQTVAGGKGDLPSGVTARTNPGISALNSPAPSIAPQSGPAGPNRGLGPKPAAPGSAPASQAPTRSLTVNNGNKPSTTQDMQRGAEQDKVGMKRQSAVAPQGAGAAGQQVGKPLPAKPPIPTAKPADAKVNGVKTAAKVKAIKKQPNARAAQRQGVATRPVRGNTAISRIAKMRADRQRNKNNDPAGPGN